MAKNLDSKTDPNIDTDSDPFADFPETDGDSGGKDPFDFSVEDDDLEEAPPMASPKKKAPTPPAAPKPPSPTAAKSTPKAPTIPKKKTETPAAAESPKVEMAADLPVQVVAVMGKKTISVQELVNLKKGQVLELNRFPNEAVDLVANGKLMAKGELVEIDGKLGVRLIKIFE